MSDDQNRIWIGLDIGSVSIKLAMIAPIIHRQMISELQQQCSDLFEPELITFQRVGKSYLIAFSRYRRLYGEPIAATIALLRPILEKMPAHFFINLAVTGIAGKLISQRLELPWINEFLGIARAVGFLHPEVRTVIEMGGDSSKYILLDPHPQGAALRDYEVNGDCAAGTGSFLDQQASRLLFPIESVGDIVIQGGKPANIAGRCSVFAKSDMIHAQQKGFQPPEILKGLCLAVVRNFKGTIIKGKPIVPPVAFIGGVAANKGIVQALGQILDLDNSDLIVPRLHHWMGAIGSAIISLDHQTNKTKVHILRSLDRLKISIKQFDRLAPLKKDNLLLLRDLVSMRKVTALDRKVPAYLGIDIGSVTTKLAVIDEQGNLIKGIYTKTMARPIEVVKKGLQEIEHELGDIIEIKAVGTTGSGRELIGQLVNADIIKDEITAHKTGAMYISRNYTEKMVDTIFDIGGQDSKFISIEDGVVVDFTMNEACAAGTGSFLEEQAEKLGINIQQEFAQLAFESEHPIRLGERCTVFMEKEIVPFLQQGAEKKDIVAGLAYSIVTNYLNRVVRGRKIGNVIYFQGGTAYNDAVAAAFATVLNKQIIVPPFNGLLGAIGVALLAREKIQRKGQTTNFRGYNLDQVEYRLRAFSCQGCTNFCDIQEFTVQGQKTYWGDKCAERYRKAVKLPRQPVIEDLIKLRETLLLHNYHQDRPGSRRIGIPRSLYWYDQFPFWRTYFEALGFQVTISDETNRPIVIKGVESRVAEPCFPITVAHGHIQNLIEKGVDFIFLPNIVDAETNWSETNSFFCPWGQTLCFVIRATPAFLSIRDRILSPNIRYRQGMEAVKRQFRKLAKQLGIGPKQSDQAIELAYQAWREFLSQLKQAGQQAISILLQQREKAIILLGRPYNIYDKIVNLNVPNKLRLNYGVNVIPLDFLDIDHIDISDLNPNMYWNYGRKILQAARWSSQFPDFHLIYITNFKCGPDSYIKHYIREAGQKPYLTLQFDEHGNDAGIITRCEAYLDSKGFLK
ncbi:MAG: acyl-CoA dehydratase activase [candidate division KSB1 bacterium]|nr:acyl-CoA dehydratase activase [candidate division KSB1 bacterium]MDZ7358971.1 acyl-CoA dehydratase activase [candidate division KSB1 bacterium]MDZ7401583.1 acyl-CoA dehydratase activase [candidate division KSB1 bacterium]